jgi:hypothetical protein
MIEVSQQLYHEEMAKAVFEHLRGFLLTKEKTIARESNTSQTM